MKNENMKYPMKFHSRVCFTDVSVEWLNQEGDSLAPNVEVNRLPAPALEERLAGSFPRAEHKPLPRPFCGRTRKGKYGWAWGLHCEAALKGDWGL